MIYTGGMPSSSWKRAYAALAQTAHLHHWGDIDVGCFRTLRTSPSAARTRGGPSACMACGRMPCHPGPSRGANWYSPSGARSSGPVSIGDGPTRPTRSGHSQSSKRR
ncbi:hypothetical protein B0B52_20230 [Polaromonas sp. A23]|nr:hypothetical protein B0B52_20230 [Polaromonas sp. A23]